MPETPRIAVSGMGMATALGQCEQACAAARAGVQRFTVWEAYSLLGVDEEFGEGEPLLTSPAPIPGEQPYLERLAALSLIAVEEALASARLRRAWIAETDLAVCLTTPPDVGEDLGLGKDYHQALSRDGALPEFRRFMPYFQGHAAGGAALAKAMSDLREGKSSRVLVGGVESFRNEVLLSQLDRDRRLKSARSPDGYVPGEAAAFFLLEREESARERGAAPIAFLDAVGLADEPHPLSSKSPSTAQGLCEAISKAIKAGAEAPTPAQPSGWVLSDFNGERRRAKEWGLTLPRMNAQLGDDVTLWHPADAFGDLGSAAVPLLVALAAWAFTHGRAPRRSALVLAASDGPLRTALLLSKA